MRKHILLLCCMMGIFLLQAQNIPLNPNVVYGKLDNGFTYYIEENTKPENRVELRLALNVGSIVEDDDQLGLAHFMEHMNFNGTKNFPGNQLVDSLQSIGVRFGQHLNAYTSFDETVYILPIPLEKPGNLDIGMKIMEDWAFNAILSDEEINKERGIILEELRLGLGADKRMLDEYLPKVLYQSRYAQRLPIGKKEIIENFDPEVIRRYHRDWHRPDLMAIIVVGDIDAKEMEQRIKSQFSKYKNPTQPRERIFYDVPNHKETLISVESDPEVSFSRVQLYYKDLGEPTAVKTESDYRRMLVKSLFSNMLNNRLKELSNSSNPPFTMAGSYHGGTWARSKEAYQSYAMTPEGGQLKALKILIEENERVKKFGFNESELERSKTEVLSWIEKAYENRDKTESRRKVNAYVNHFLEQTPAPGVEWEFSKYQEMLPGITLEEVNSLIQNFIRDENRVVVITGPEKETIKQPTEAEVLATLNSVDVASLEPYDDKIKITHLVENIPAKGKVVQTSSDEKLGTTTWVLSNGAKVTFKKTDFKNDEILFKAMRLGGSSTISDEVFLETQWAYSALAEAGLNGYSKTDLDKYMAGKQVYVSPFFGSTQVGFNGQSTPKDIETLFELIYANFTGLNKDKEAYEGYVSKQSSFYNNLSSQPQFYFMLEHAKFRMQNNPRSGNIIPLEEDWEKTNYELAYQVFTDKLKNAGDFNFYFIGNVDEAKLKELSEKYLAVLPAKGKKEIYKDLGYRSVSGTHKKEYKKGADPKSFVEITYEGETEYSEDEDLAMDALAEVIGIKLVEKLREDESGTYTSSVSGGLSSIPYGSYSFRIFFPCGPENVERLIQVSKEEIARVIENGPDANDLKKFKEAEINDYKEKEKINRTWMNVLSSENLNPGAKQRYLSFLDRLDKLTAKDVQNVAKKYLTRDYIQAVLYPEEMAEMPKVEEKTKVKAKITKDEVVKNYYQKIGGLKTLQNIKSTQMELDLLINGLNMDVKMLQSGEDKLKSVVSVMGQEIIAVVNGDDAYKIQGGQKMDMAPAEVEQNQKKFPAKMLMLPELENKVEAYQKGDKLYYVLESATEKLTFDATTGLLTERVDSLANTSSNYTDWKSYDGILYPSKTKIITAGQTLVQNVKTLKFNKNIPATEFQ
ncbi:insulinase family protein [Weeksellaceae bacterium KMM 9713]|uniref:Insulinase family protein n=1 Tax=Profundicola chukchiensis TaxID=2961959 RepID=A0A9X4RUM2_9FLAO|nr:insulinase family protein [Profundicola chukchiensis]MDG4946288.1 insulinase family protein [Profundicola chukchiensis]